MISQSRTVSEIFQWIAGHDDSVMSSRNYTLIILPKSVLSKSLIITKEEKNIETRKQAVFTAKCSFH